MIGRTLSHYKVLEKIGEGGMGEVYLAKDTKLDREVAVKVLPATFAENKERLARFEREARLLASLNHPNIAAIFELEESEGVHFLALEYVPGETLAERIKRGPIPIDEVLPLFKQIAEGLEAAHEKGVIHRDLKPANIKVTPEGKVKVLDFGLAKAMAGETPSQGMSESPTITRDATETGVLLGTAPYVSPEQARGKAVDKRTDIWAFGCCLYEALTGNVAFLGETVSDTLVAILEKEPDWHALPETTPALVQRMLRRCLNKDGGERIQHIGDARLEIQDILFESELAVPDTAALPRRFGWRGTIPWLWTFAVVAMTAVVSWSLWNLVRDMRPTPSSQPVRFTISLPERVSLASPPGMAISPDGEHVVFVGSEAGESRLFSRRLADRTVEALPETDDAVDVFFSPEGEWVGFSTRYQAMKKVALTGGVPLVLCTECASAFHTGTWGSTDAMVFTPGDRYGLVRISASGGGMLELLVQPDESEPQIEWYVSPQILPNANAVLFTIQSGGKARIGAFSVDTGQVRTILEPGGSPRYLPTGHLVYVVGDQLLAIPFNAETLEVEGTPTPVLSGLEVRFLSGASYDVSQNGTLIYASKTGSQLVWRDHDGELRPIPTPAGDYSFPVISPDGRFVAVSVEEGFSRNIWVSDLERGTLSRLTFGGDDVFSLWTPDGKHIVYTSGAMGGYNLFWTPGDGSGKAEALTTGEWWFKPTSWSPDGRKLLVNASDANSRSLDVYELEMGAERTLTPLLSENYRNVNAMFSRDGHWIAYQSVESGRLEVYVRSYPGLEEKQQVSVNGGSNPIWHPNGRELIFAAGDRLMSASISAEPKLRVGVPKLLYEMGQYAGFAGVTGRNYDLSPDGEKFLFAIREESSELHVVLNWFEELKRLVPTN